MSNEVGLRLKELRRKLNMTQPQLGEKMGIKATTLARRLGRLVPGKLFSFVPDTGHFAGNYSNYALKIISLALSLYP